MPTFLLAAVLAAVSAGASAQDGTATGPMIEYRSAFDRYRGWSAETPRNWREVNEEVERLGGHAGHLRGGAPAPEQRQPTPTVSPQTPATPQGDRHHGRPAAEQKR